MVSELCESSPRTLSIEFFRSRGLTSHSHALTLAGGILYDSRTVRTCFHFIIINCRDFTPFPTMPITIEFNCVELLARSRRLHCAVINLQQFIYAEYYLAELLIFAECYVAELNFQYPVVA